MTILINLNDARKKLNELEGSAEYNKGVTDAFNALFDLPTIEAEPVKHGRWIALKITERPFRGFYMRSECNEVTIKAYPYCHCGAKMDEVKE